MKGHSATELLVGICVLLVPLSAAANTDWDVYAPPIDMSGYIEDPELVGQGEGCEPEVQVAPGESKEVCNDSAGNKKVRVCNSAGTACTTTNVTLKPGEKAKVNNSSESTDTAKVDLVPA